jgi:hypothetical protein
MGCHVGRLVADYIAATSTRELANRMRDITSAVHAKDVDDYELVQILQGRVNQAQFTSPIQIDLPDATKSVLRILYTKKGALARVLSTLDDEQVSAIAAEVTSKLLCETKPAQSRKVLFAQRQGQSGGGGNRTRVLRFHFRASPGAACFAFLGPGSLAGELLTGPAAVWFS